MAEGKSVTLILVIFCLQGILGSVLKLAQEPCPMLFCMDAGDCTNPKVNYFEINGHKCIGCPTCPADEEGNKRFVQWGDGNIWGEVLPGSIFDCPFIDCASPGPCIGGKLVYSYMTWRGQKCAACSRCIMPDIPLNLEPKKRNVIPIDLAHLCPIVDCAYPGPCSKYKPTYFNVHGMKCQGCPVCETVDILPKVESRGIDKPSVCPMVKCRNPGPCDTDYAMSTLMVHGVECPMCPYCRSTEKQNRDVLNPGVIHINVCPIPMCAFPGPCDVPLQTSYMTVNGKKCPMCSYCPSGKGSLSGEILKATSE